MIVVQIWHLPEDREKGAASWAASIDEATELAIKALIAAVADEQGGSA